MKDNLRESRWVGPAFQVGGVIVALAITASNTQLKFEG